MPPPRNREAQRVRYHPAPFEGSDVTFRASRADHAGELFSRWEPDRPLAALWSAPIGGRARWTLLAQPQGRFQFTRDPNGAGRSAWIGNTPAPIEFSHDPCRDLARLVNATRTHTGRRATRAPFTSGWIGWISYDLGRLVEPAARARRRPVEDRPWPLVEFHRCRGAIAVEHGAIEPIPVGDAPAMPRSARRSNARFTLDRFASATGREAYIADARRVVEYIRAGDVFQVNLAHRLSAPFEGSARSLFLRMAYAARPWYGAYLECDDGPNRRALLSASPELFLQFDPVTRRLTSRPMKGTRAGRGDPRELRASAKDRAELNMIIDLMRNDLGRVCRFGTVRVPSARRIEAHGAMPRHPSGAGGPTPAVWQGVGTVRGVLRDGVGPVDALREAFPPGSVTGAPKVRAMQIIDELEPVARGPYCGSVGFIADDGAFAFNVAIRTAAVTGSLARNALDSFASGVLDYGVGAGIVADSDPDAEWRETLDKAAVIRAIARGPRAARV